MNNFFRITFILSAAFLIFFAGALLTYHHHFPYNLIFRVNAGKTAIQEMANAWIIEHNRPTQAAVPPSWAIKKYDSAQALNGYTLVCPNGFSLAQLIDMDGKVVHSWQTNKALYTPSEYQRLDGAYLYPNGELLAIDHYTDSSKRRIVRLDKKSNIRWEYVVRTHHDLQLDDYGNIYTLIDPLDNTKPDGAPYFNTPFLHDYILILSPSGKELKRISIVRAFLDSPFASFLEKIPTQSDKGDFLHNNTVNVLSSENAKAFPQFKAGFILISARNIHTIAVIDPQTQQVVWAKKGMWRSQHYPQFMPNGHIRLLDNNGLGGKRSRLLDIDVVSGKPVSSPIVDNAPNFWTEFRGAHQTLANGNLLIMASNSKQLLETNTQGQILWKAEISTHFGNSIECAHRYTANQLPFLGKK